MSTEQLLRAWLEVDLDAIVHNARTLAAHAGVPLLPMVKADAYGLGAVPVARALEAIDPWGFGVATLQEGIELRAAGVGRPIVVFNPLLIGELSDAWAHRLSPTLSEAPVVARWGALSGNAPWHLAIDTGMSRTGVRWDAIETLRAVLVEHPPLAGWTHFHSAEADEGSIRVQLDRFERALARLPSRPAVLHAENSAAIERLRAPSRWTFVRPGVFLYGVDLGEVAASRADATPPGAEATRGPHDHWTPPRSRPVAALRARIADLRWVEAGESVSYGASFRATERRRIATLSAGYADGYRRAFGNVGRALVRGIHARVAGVVTMDMTMIDVTGIDCAIGDVATLLGPDSPDSGRESQRPGGVAQRGDADGAAGASGAGIDMATAARAAGLSPYEVLTGLRGRLPRVYLDRSRE